MNVEAMCSKNEVASRRTLPASLADLKIDAIIALIDMDCFYVQVELRREPEFRGKPACVVQYKTRHKGGGIIALSYEAREKGVKRFHHADEARQVCPEVQVFVVPELNGKADLTRYREAGAEVIQVMKKKFSMVERASIDEAYVDLTSEVNALLPRYLNDELFLEADELGVTSVSGSDSVAAWLDRTHLQRETAVTQSDQKKNVNNLALAIAAKLINELRQEILESTQFHCSAGISHSKTLSKLACGLNKPRKQTILPTDAVAPLFAKTNITDVRFLGGKLGKLIVENLGITSMGELCKVSKSNLLRYFDLKTADWLMGISEGKDNESVQPRDQPKSIGCSKNFLGKDALKTREEVKMWMAHFATELSNRLKKDQAESNRTASILTVYITYLKQGQRKQISRCVPMTSYEQEDLTKDGFIVADKLAASLGWQSARYAHPLISLGLTASKMREGQQQPSNRIESYFSKSPRKEVLLVKEVKEVKEMEEVKEVKEMKEMVPGLDVILGEEYSVEKALSETVAIDEECQIISVTPSKRPLIPSPCKLSGKVTVEVQPVYDSRASTSRFALQHAEPSLSDETAEKRPFNFKETFDEELLLYPEFKIHRCARCQELMWYPSMKAEHDDYHMALDLSSVPDSDDGLPRKKLKLTDTLVKKTKKPAGASVATLDRFLTKRSS